MASDEPTGGNIQHATPAEHNTSTIPSSTVVDADGTSVVDASGAVVVDANGATVADEDAMPTVAVDYRWPMAFVSEGLASWSIHSTLLDVR